jgi:hypothetical protein
MACQQPYLQQNQYIVSVLDIRPTPVATAIRSVLFQALRIAAGRY